MVSSQSLQELSLFNLNFLSVVLQGASIEAFCCKLVLEEFCLKFSTCRYPTLEGIALVGPVPMEKVGATRR